MFNSKVFLAEFIGTFALVFVGMGASMTTPGLIVVAFAHGFTIAVFVYAYGYISGAHFNPAVTFGLWLNGTVKIGQAAFYWIAQFGGAILAAYFLKVIMAIVVDGGTIDAGATVGALTDKAPVLAMIMEAILTFFLVNTILHTAVGSKAGPLAGWAIGATLVVAILAGGPFTGASLNPARTFGPAIFSKPSITNAYTYLIYLIGPLLGSTLAVIAYKFFSSTNEDVDEPEVPVEVIPAKTKKPAVRKTTKK